MAALFECLLRSHGCDTVLWSIVSEFHHHLAVCFGFFEPLFSAIGTLNVWTLEDSVQQFKAGLVDFICTDQFFLDVLWDFLWCGSTFQIVIVIKQTNAPIRELLEEDILELLFALRVELKGLFLLIADLVAACGHCTCWQDGWRWVRRECRIWFVDPFPAFCVVQD